MTIRKKRVPSIPPPGSLSEEFQRRLSKIDADAKAAGANMTIVCKLAKISRADPVRWRNNTPKTIKLIDRMEKVVKKLAEKYGKSAANHSKEE